jgi:hypothetical protein
MMAWTRGQCPPQPPKTSLIYTDQFCLFFLIYKEIRTYSSLRVFAARRGQCPPVHPIVTTSERASPSMPSPGPFWRNPAPARARMRRGIDGPFRAVNAVVTGMLLTLCYGGCVR